MVFLHYLAKQTNTNIASYHSLSQDYFVKNFLKHTVHRLSISSFIPLSKQPTVVFEVSSLHADSRLQTCSLRAALTTLCSKRQPVTARVHRHCGSASRTHAAA